MYNSQQYKPPIFSQNDIIQSKIKQNSLKNIPSSNQDDMDMDLSNESDYEYISQTPNNLGNPKSPIRNTNNIHFNSNINPFNPFVRSNLTPNSQFYSHPRHFVAPQPNFQLPNQPQILHRPLINPIPLQRFNFNNNNQEYINTIQTQPKNVITMPNTFVPVQNSCPLRPSISLATNNNIISNPFNIYKKSIPKKLYPVERHPLAAGFTTEELQNPFYKLLKPSQMIPTNSFPFLNSSQTNQKQFQQNLTSFPIYNNANIPEIKKKSKIPAWLKDQLEKKKINEEKKRRQDEASLIPKILKGENETDYNSNRYNLPYTGYNMPGSGISDRLASGEYKKAFSWKRIVAEKRAKGLFRVRFILPPDYIDSSSSCSENEENGLVFSQKKKEKINKPDLIKEIVPIVTEILKAVTNSIIIECVNEIINENSGLKTSYKNCDHTNDNINKDKHVLVDLNSKNAKINVSKHSLSPSPPKILMNKESKMDSKVTSSIKKGLVDYSSDEEHLQISKANSNNNDNKKRKVESKTKKHKSKASKRKNKKSHSKTKRTVSRSRKCRSWRRRSVSSSLHKRRKK